MYTRQTWKCNTDNSTSIRRWNVAPEYQRRRSATCRCCPRPRNASRQSAHDEAAQQSFDQLKLALTSPPALAIPLDSGEFILDTDASQGTIGAVLSQIQDGVERVVAYASRRLDRREANYCHLQRITRSGLLFLRYFRQYLLGREFRVRTDHSALTWLKRTPDPIGQQARWLEIMEEFHFTIEHRR